MTTTSAAPNLHEEHYQRALASYNKWFAKTDLANMSPAHAFAAYYRWWDQHDGGRFTMDPLEARDAYWECKAHGNVPANGACDCYANRKPALVTVLETLEIQEKLAYRELSNLEQLFAARDSDEPPFRRSDLLALQREVDMQARMLQEQLSSGDDAAFAHLVDAKQARKEIRDLLEQWYPRRRVAA